MGNCKNLRTEDHLHNKKVIHNKSTPKNNEHNHFMARGNKSCLKIMLLSVKLLNGEENFSKFFQKLIYVKILTCQKEHTNRVKEKEKENTDF